jgi:hypothetical protein
MAEPKSRVCASTDIIRAATEYYRRPVMRIFFCVIAYVLAASEPQFLPVIQG